MAGEEKPDLSDAGDFRRRLRALVAAFKKLDLSADIYDVLIGRGEFFTGAAAVRANPVIYQHFRLYRPKPKQCFYNCQWFVVCDDTDLAAYYEGYVTGPAGTLIHHGWLVAGGAVYDPTLEAVSRVARRKYGAEYPAAEGRRYFGVRFTKLDAAANMAKESCGPILEHLTGIV